MCENLRQEAPTFGRRASLHQHLTEYVYPTVAAIVEYIQDRFGIGYMVNGMTSRLHRMDYTHKKPKVVQGKADEAAQRQFVQHYEALKSSKKPGDPIYFMGGVHPQHNSVAAYGWIKRVTLRRPKATAVVRG